MSPPPPPCSDPCEISPEAGLAPVRLSPPANELAAQRQTWTSTGYSLPPNTEKPAHGPIDPNPKREGPLYAPLSATVTYLYTLSYLVFFSIFGTLARIGLQALTFYPGAPMVTGVLWPNVGGSLLMGFLLEDKNIFREEWGDESNKQHCDNQNITTPEAAQEESKRHKSIKKTIPLYIGLTTGFCGSFTSFSSFIRDIFLALSNDLPNPSPDYATVSRNGGYSFMALVAIILIEVSLSMGALMVGAHLALALEPITPAFPFRIIRRFLDPLFVFLGWGCWLGAIFMAIWPPDRHDPGLEHWRSRAVFALVFAPLGCLFRFYVSLALNARIPAFPLGTFTVNIFGTIILAMCFDLQHVNGIGASLATVATYSIITSCQVLQGVMDGFCGTATTVSTWVAELHGLSSRRHAYVYGATSVGVALGFFIIIAGSLRWTLGFANPACG